MPTKVLHAVFGAAALSLCAALPCAAQTTAEPADRPMTTQSIPDASGGASAAPAAPQATPSAEAAPPPAAAAQPAPPDAVDPVIAQVRQLLAEPARGNADRGDRAALTAFYAERTGAPLWVTTAGFTPRAKDALAEIAKADDWGLPAAAFELPRLAAAEQSPAALADAEVKLGLAVLKYARYARGGRLDPAQISRYIDQKPALRDPKVVMAAMAATEAPSDYLRHLHPQHEQFQRLRQALLKARGGANLPASSAADDSVRLPDGPTLKLGMRHAQVALLRQRLQLPAAPGTEAVFDLEVQAALREFQQTHGIQPSGMLTPRTRSALNGGVERPKRPAGSDVERILANMERWRWLPEDMGELYVWDNIPEFMTRVVKKGRLLHSAKIIVGKPDTPTVVFSADMKFIVFHPEWGVPDSIKVKEILPYMRPTGGDFFGFFGGGSDTRILQRHNLRVSYNGRPVDAAQINWNDVDIRRFTFIQPPGPANVLGVVKFRFPNRHDIYMHDTPQRELFEKPTRLYSHGCMRVQNPGRLAELLLEEDKGWSATQVRSLLAQGYNNEVPLTKHIPVHVTYFTMIVEDNGEVKHFADVYGHDSRVVAALTGRRLPPEAAPSDDTYREASRRPAAKYKQSADNPFSALFGN